MNDMLPLLRRIKDAPRPGEALREILAEAHRFAPHEECEARELDLQKRVERLLAERDRLREALELALTWAPPDRHADIRRAALLEQPQQTTR